MKQRQSNGNMPQNGQGGILFWSIFVLFLVGGIAFFPISLQSFSSERNRLTKKMMMLEKELDSGKKKLANLNVNLAKFRGESIKQYAEKLGVRPATPEQTVYISMNGLRQARPQIVKQAVHEHTISQLIHNKQKEP